MLLTSPASAAEFLTYELKHRICEYLTMSYDCQNQIRGILNASCEWRDILLSVLNSRGVSSGVGDRDHLLALHRNQSRIQRLLLRCRGQRSIGHNTRFRRPTVGALQDAVCADKLIECLEMGWRAVRQLDIDNGRAVMSSMDHMTRFCQTLALNLPRLSRLSIRFVPETCASFIEALARYTPGVRNLTLTMPTVLSLATSDAVGVSDMVGFWRSDLGLSEAFAKARDQFVELCLDGFALTPECVVSLSRNQRGLTKLTANVTDMSFMLLGTSDRFMALTHLELATIYTVSDQCRPCADSARQERLWLPSRNFPSLRSLKLGRSVDPLLVVAGGERRVRERRVEMTSAALAQEAMAPENAWLQLGRLSLSYISDKIVKGMVRSAPHLRILQACCGGSEPESVLTLNGLQCLMESLEHLELCKVGQEFSTHSYINSWSGKTGREGPLQERHSEGKEDDGKTSATKLGLDVRRWKCARLHTLQVANWVQDPETLHALLSGFSHLHVLDIGLPVATNCSIAEPHTKTVQCGSNSMQRFKVKFIFDGTNNLHGSEDRNARDFVHASTAALIKAMPNLKQVTIMPGQAGLDVKSALKEQFPHITIICI
ncbi:hypothetical protein EV182_000283 [Spiromyces aspiralis]|uniref:Uncharacterized protein n=1 Tax=Spiromyces aspiralis TaxID=68401 RepID=A0ACC1HVH6_9FUNG|nr:hypothetical protein EV182_000283 [Spiromyces aspiralis]